MVQRDLPNLHRALDLTLEAKEYETVVDFADRIELFLNFFGRWRERDALLNKIRTAVDSLAHDGPLTKAQFIVASRRGEVLWQQGRAAEARSGVSEVASTYGRRDGLRGGGMIVRKPSGVWAEVSGTRGGREKPKFSIAKPWRSSHS